MCGSELSLVKSDCLMFHPSLPRSPYLESFISIGISFCEENSRELCCADLLYSTKLQADQCFRETCLAFDVCLIWSDVNLFPIKSEHGNAQINLSIIIGFYFTESVTTPVGPGSNSRVVTQ